jgi:hypothetical protein
MRYRTLILAVAAASLGLPAAVSAAAPAPRAVLELGFAAREPGAVTALNLVVGYRGADPAGKPSPIRGGFIEAPAGTRFGGGAAIPACTASDADLRASGRAACPSASRLGGGSLTAITGFGSPFDPVQAKITVFKTSSGFLELVQQPESDATLGLDRPTVEGSRITIHPPTTPGGPPDGETAVRDIRFVIAANGFVITPPACPADGTWRSNARFTFADGHVATAQATTPCRPPGAVGGPAPRLRFALAVAPRRALAGRFTTYRFRVSGARGCRAGAIVRFARRRLRTNAAGRVTLRVRARVPGVRTARAGKPGCGRAIARVRVVAP